MPLWGVLRGTEMGNGLCPRGTTMQPDKDQLRKQRCCPRGKQIGAWRRQMEDNLRAAEWAAQVLRTRKCPEAVAVSKSHKHHRAVGGLEATVHAACPGSSGSPVSARSAAPSLGRPHNWNCPQCHECPVRVLPPPDLNCMLGSMLPREFMSSLRPGTGS